LLSVTGRLQSRIFIQVRIIGLPGSGNLSRIIHDPGLQAGPGCIDKVREAESALPLKEIAVVEKVKKGIILLSLPYYIIIDMGMFLSFMFRLILFRERLFSDPRMICS